MAKKATFIVLPLLIVAAIWGYFHQETVIDWLLKFDVPVVIGRNSAVIQHETTFYPGSDVNSVLEALVAQTLFGSDFCRQPNVTCTGNVYLHAGAQVRTIKRVSLTYGRDQTRLDLTQIEIQSQKGWVLSDALQ